MRYGEDLVLIGAGVLAGGVVGTTILGAVQGNWILLVPLGGMILMAIGAFIDSL